METETLEKELIIPDEVEKAVKDLIDQSHEIVLYNDDVNTFDTAIFGLISYCGHSVEQAEQCAMIVHNRGKCSVKKGTYEELKTICNALTRLKLDAKLY